MALRTIKAEHLFAVRSNNRTNSKQVCGGKQQQ
jgi:hypothetical protein